MAARYRINVNRDGQWLTLNARLRPGVSLKQAVAALNVVKKRIDDTYRKDEKQHHPPITLTSAGGLIGGAETPALGIMFITRFTFCQQLS
jgi:hypothetical protein